jgi:hypothetical protein
MNALTTKMAATARRLAAEREAERMLSARQMLATGPEQREYVLRLKAQHPHWVAAGMSASKAPAETALRSYMGGSGGVPLSDQTLCDLVLESQRRMRAALMAGQKASDDRRRPLRTPARCADGWPHSWFAMPAYQ